MPGDEVEVVIVDYDPAWPAAFNRERMTIAVALHGIARTIDHIGSTAVPGLAAKPIIDILVGVDSLDTVPGCVSSLEALGYEYLGENGIPERHYFHKPGGGGARDRTHHLHLVVVGSAHHCRHRAFSDYLRAHDDTRDEYAALKRELAERFAMDRAAYTDAKSDFIRAVEARALAEWPTST